jgi:hypothetical protein
VHEGWQSSPHYWQPKIYGLMVHSWQVCRIRKGQVCLRLYAVIVHMASVRLGGPNADVNRGPYAFGTRSPAARQIVGSCTAFVRRWVVLTHMSSKTETAVLALANAGIATLCVSKHIVVLGPCAVCTESQLQRCAFAAVLPLAPYPTQPHPLHPSTAVAYHIRYVVGISATCMHVVLLVSPDRDDCGSLSSMPCQGSPSCSTALIVRAIQTLCRADTPACCPSCMHSNVPELKHCVVLFCTGSTPSC